MTYSWGQAKEDAKKTVTNPVQAAESPWVQVKQALAPAAAPAPVISDPISIFDSTVKNNPTAVKLKTYSNPIPVKATKDTLTAAKKAVADTGVGIQETAKHAPPGVGGLGQKTAQLGKSVEDVGKGKVGNAVADLYKGSAPGQVTTGTANTGGRVAASAKKEGETLSKAWNTGITTPATKAAQNIKDTLSGAKPLVPLGSGGASGPGSGGAGIPVPPLPTRPAFNAQTNADGTIKKPLSNSVVANANPVIAGQVGPAAQASQGIAGAALTDRATQSGPSPWLKLQLQQQGIEEQNAQGNATAANAGATAGSRTALASHGGLSSGAMERVQKSGANDLALQRQTIANQGQQSRLGLGIADENTKTGLLGTAAGLEQGLSQFNTGQTNTGSIFDAGQRTTASADTAGNNIGASKFDISNALGDTQAGRSDALEYYKQLMGDRASSITANAIGNSGGGKKG